MNKFRILIVDDEPDIRMILKTALGTKFEVIEAENGIDALEKIERAEPDFAVLDVMMPLMDGFDTCAAIRKHVKFSTIGVYFLTAKTDKEAVKKGYSLGANLYLQKPFDPFRLLKNIEVYFEEQKISPMKKKYTIEQLVMIDKNPINRKADGTNSTLIRPGYLTQKNNVKTASLPADATKPPEFQTGLPRILIASTDLDFLINIFSYVKKDYEAVLEHNALSIIESIINYQPEIIIIDSIISGLDTLKLIQLLKNNKNLNYIEIIFVFSEKYEININALLSLSGNKVIMKDDKASIIQQKIASICYKPSFQVYNKLVKHEDIPTENLQKIFEVREEERKSKEREYFKLKHRNLQDMFKGLQKSNNEKYEEEPKKDLK